MKVSMRAIMIMKLLKINESDEEDKLKFDFKKFQTIKHNEVQNKMN